MRARILSTFSSLRGWLTGPHHILSLLDGSSTTNLSLGERPVYWPVLTTSGPSAPSIPSPLRMASSTRRAVVRLCRDSSILMSRYVSAVDAISCIYKPPCSSCSFAGTNYELRITNYELRITNYELQSAPVVPG